MDGQEMIMMLGLLDDLEYVSPTIDRFILASPLRRFAPGRRDHGLKEGYRKTPQEIQSEQYAIESINLREKEMGRTRPGRPTA